MFLSLFIIFVIVYAVVRGRYLMDGVEGLLGLREDESEEELVLEKVSKVLKSEDVEILEYDGDLLYKVRSGGVVVDVYMDEEFEGKLKYIVYGNSVVYASKLDDEMEYGVGYKENESVVAV